MRHVVAAFGLSILAVGASGEILSGYHIGNSLTNDSRPDLLGQFAATAGHGYTAGWHIQGGMPLHRLYQNPAGAGGGVNPAFGNLSEALPNHRWDVVTMQPFWSQGSRFSDDVATIGALIDLTRSNPANGGTTYYIYAGWSDRTNYSQVWDGYTMPSGNPPTWMARDYFHTLIETVRAQNDAEINMIPVGEVLYVLDQRFRAGELPGFDGVEDLYRDEVHLSYDIGRHVALATTYATIFGEDPSGIASPLQGNYSDEVLDFLNDTIWDVVSSHPYTNVPAPAATTSFAVLIGLRAVRRRRRG